MNSTLTLTQEWDKTFPQNAAVDHSKVTFHNRFGRYTSGYLLVIRPFIVNSRSPPEMNSFRV